MALLKAKYESTLNNVDFDDQHPTMGDSRRELLSGLLRSQKYINPKFFYDKRGSELFDQITQLPEYYPSRTEISILKQYSKEISEHCEKGCVLIEPGSGSSEKVRLLLDELRPRTYVPLDISAEFLYLSAIKMGEQYPWLNIHAVCADFSHDWSLPNRIPEGKRVVFYPGSTIGNLEPEVAIAFLSRLKRWIKADGGMLIGVDLHKSEDVLNAAYNDSAGVTRAFNMNLLEHVNRVISTDFNVDQFSHKAYYNQEKKRIEMHLVSDKKQYVQCGDEQLEFAPGETIHTENSYKYTLSGFQHLVAEAGCCVRKSWTDDMQFFSMHYIEPIT